MARNFFSLCLIFAFFLLDIPDHGNHSYMYGKDLLRTFLFLLLPAFFLRFFLQFPSPKRKESGEPIKYRLLLLPAWILFLLIAGLDKSQLTAAGSTAEQVIEIISDQAV